MKTEKKKIDIIIILFFLQTVPSYSILSSVVGDQWKKKKKKKTNGKILKMTAGKLLPKAQRIESPSGPKEESRKAAKGQHPRDNIFKTSCCVDEIASVRAKYLKDCVPDRNSTIDRTKQKKKKTKQKYIFFFFRLTLWVHCSLWNEGLARM